jgi:hypothetical protein
VVIGAARTSLLTEWLPVVLKDAPNTGQKKFEMGIENRYIVKGGKVKVTLARERRFLQRTCGMLHGHRTAMAEIVAGPGAAGQRPALQDLLRSTPFLSNGSRLR